MKLPRPHRAGAPPGGPLVSGAWTPPALLPLAAAIIISVAPGISSAAGLPTPEVLTLARSEVLDARINEFKSSVTDKVGGFMPTVSLLQAYVPDDDPPLPPEPPPAPPPRLTPDAIARKEAAAELFETVVDLDELNLYYVLKGSRASSSSGAPKAAAGVKGGEGAPGGEAAAKRAEAAKQQAEAAKQQAEVAKQQAAEAVEKAKLAALKKEPKSAAELKAEARAAKEAAFD